MAYLKSLILFALLAFNIAAYSQALPVPQVVFPRTNIGSSVTFGPLTADASNAAKFSFGAAANGSIFADTGAALATPGGRSIALGVRSTIPRAVAGKAVGKFILKSAAAFSGLQTFLAVGTAGYELAKELGFSLDPSPDGSLFPSHKTSITTTSAPCSIIFGNGATLSGNSCETVVRDGIRAFNHEELNAVNCSPVYPATTPCSALNKYNIPLSFVVQWPAPPSTSTVDTVSPASLSELQTAIESAPADQLAKVLPDALKSGEAVDVTPETVTGPKSNPLGQSVTQNLTNNTTETTNKTENYHYDGNKVTIDNSSSVVIINNDTGLPTVGSTTVNSDPIPESKGLCELYPDILACQQLDQQDAPDLQTKDATITVTPDSGWGSGSGSCPADRSLSHAVFSFKIYCDFASGLRPIIIAMAWLAAAFILVGVKSGGD